MGTISGVWEGFNEGVTCYTPPNPAQRGDRGGGAEVQ